MGGKNKSSTIIEKSISINKQRLRSDKYTGRPKYRLSSVFHLQSLEIFLYVSRELRKLFQRRQLIRSLFLYHIHSLMTLVVLLGHLLNLKLERCWTQVKMDIVLLI